MPWKVAAPPPSASISEHVLFCGGRNLCHGRNQHSIMAANVQLQLWGEPDSEDARSHSTAQKQPSQPLWSESRHQKVSSVTCQVPFVCEQTTSRACTTIHKYGSSTVVWWRLICSHTASPLYWIILEMIKGVI